MNKFLWIGILIAFGVASAAAQSPTPVATPASTPVPQTQMPVMRPGLSNLARRSTSVREPAELRQMLLQRYALPLYRKPGGRELRVLAPDPALSARYAELLTRRDSGIFKLVRDAGCAENARVLNASEECLKYQFPGAGNSFSFRTESYRIRHLADLTYEAGSFLMPGVHMYGLMVDLGDVPLEPVDLQTRGVRYLTALQPTNDYAKAVEMDKQAEAGIWQDGFIYRRGLPAADGHTYVSRSIAYQGRVMKAIPGAQYNELEFDKRRDVITAFKVVQTDPDGAVTIVWTQLSNIESIKLRNPVKDSTGPLADKPRTRSKFTGSAF